ncbi:MAG: glycogen synthase GlgA [Elusimicrobiota bacterium]
MNILMAASEAVPFCKTGGLADVVGALAQVMADRGHSVTLVIPFYRSIKNQFSSIKDTSVRFQVPTGNMMRFVKVFELPSPHPQLRYLLIGHNDFFDREGIYNDSHHESFGDNHLRYAFFSRAVLELAKAIKFTPDVIHVHDWQTGLLPCYLKSIYKNDEFFRKTATLFSIHNMAYQGNYPDWVLPQIGIPWSEYTMSGVEFYNKVSYLKSGVVYSDAINTVSPHYAQEVQTSAEFGCGLEGVLSHRSEYFKGILNGLDVNYWNPSTDKNISAHYSSHDLMERDLCKKDLQSHCGLPNDFSVPLLGFVGRMENQKGVDTLIDLAPQFLKNGCQFVALGQGQRDYLNALRHLQFQYPLQVRLIDGFAETVAHKIYAGSDLFLMPSRYEPCGLGQMIAMRYGSLPVVTPVGGLVDTVVSYKNKKGNGFIAQSNTPGSFLNAIQEAFSLWKDKKSWAKIQKNAMRVNFSWDHSAQEYEKFYEKALRWNFESKI